jgi:hypothetical protein
MRTLFVIILLIAFILPILTFVEVQTITATHTYIIMGDDDSNEDVATDDHFE